MKEVTTKTYVNGIKRLMLPSLNVNQENYFVTENKQN